MVNITVFIPRFVQGEGYSANTNENKEQDTFGSTWIILCNPYHISVF